MADELAGKVTLVTGSSGNIGSGIARVFCAAGSRLLLHGVQNKATLESLASELSTEANPVSTWVGEINTDQGSQALIDQCLADFGALDCLVNNAGIFPATSLAEMTASQWHEVLDANLTSAALLTKAAAKVMKPGSAIVNIASIEANGAMPDHSHYAASKAGMLALTRNCANELGPLEITVNAVSPGLIDRPGLKEQWPQGYQAWCEKSPLGRPGQPQDVAAACLFLCGPSARWVSGTNLVVDGGLQAAKLF